MEVIFARFLSTEERKAIRDDVIVKAESEDLISYSRRWIGQPLPHSQYSIERSGVVEEIVPHYVAYGYIIGPDGRPRSSSIVANEGAVASAHQRAQQWFAEKLQRARSEAKVHRVTGHGSGTSTAWQEIHRELHDNVFEVEPYGVVKNHYILWRLFNDGSPTLDGLAIYHLFQMQPGRSMSGPDWENSDWRNYEGFARHPWYASALFESLDDWDPEVTIGGATSSSGGEIKPAAAIPPVAIALAVAIGGGFGAGLLLHWHFDKPPDVTITSHANDQGGYVQWTVDFGVGSDASKTTVKLEPGSSVTVTQPRAPAYDWFPLRAEGRFHDPCPWWFDDFVTLRMTNGVLIPPGPNFLVGAPTTDQLAMVSNAEAWFEAVWPGTNVEAVHTDGKVLELMEHLAADRIDVVLSRLPVDQIGGIDPNLFEDYKLPDGTYVIVLKYHLRTSSIIPARADDFVNYLWLDAHGSGT
ncbi:hypothetical protein M1O12_00830 [Dehalococcoidia bacterium]|nr:hypothetical protein [Dehalococcoidia bacterium]